MTPIAEWFESRTLLSTIVWDNMGSASSDTDDFNAVYGSNAGAARAIVQTAIQAWGRVIQNFNYANVSTAGNAPAANTYTLNISAKDLYDPSDPATLGNRGVTGITGVDGAGKPFSADITLDDNGGGQGWYFDPTPGDNAEFTSLLNRFAATFTAATGNDFYRTIVHEMGHAMGLSLDGRLALSTGGFLTPAGTDQNDSKAGLQVFTGATTTATITSNGGGHIYEGPVDPAFPGAPVNPFDLMNAGRTIGPPPTRELITDLDAGILRDAYGYTVATPSSIQTFLANLDTTTGELTINGDIDSNGFTTGRPLKTFIDDVITIDRQGSNLRVDVDGLVVTFPFASINSWKVVSTGGDDRITVDFASGSPIPAGGASVDGGGPSTPPGDSLTFVNQGVDTPVVFTPSTTGPSNAGSAVIGGNVVNFVAVESVTFGDPIRDFTYVTPLSADDLKIDSPAPGRNRIGGTSGGGTVLPFSFSDITNFVLDTGANGGTAPNDSVTLYSALVATGLRNFTILTGAGDDQLTVYQGFALPTPGGAFIYDAGPGTGDRLEVHATGTSVGGFSPDGSTAFAGAFKQDGADLATLGLEFAEVSEFASFVLSTPNDSDQMTIAPDFVGYGAPGENKVAGSSGGVAFSTLSFYDVDDFLIDAASNQTSALVGDSFTIQNPGGAALQASSLKNFTIRSGPGDDVLTVNAVDFRLPVAGGRFVFDGGTGGSNLRGLISLDRIVVNADVDYDLSDIGPRGTDGTAAEGLLAIAPAGSGAAASALLGSIDLIGVEAATLVGGASNNRMDGSRFSGGLVLRGLGGNDTLIGGWGDNVLEGGDGNDLLIAGDDHFAKPGLGSQNHVILGGGGTNLLDGGAGDDVFQVALAGTATLIGGAGDDTFQVLNAGGLVTAPVGGITVDGGGQAGDRLVISGGGGPTFNEYYILGPADAGQIVTTNNYNTNGPTISQFIRYTRLAAIDDSATVANLHVVAASADAPIGGASAFDLAAGRMNLTIGGAPAPAIRFMNKSRPSILLADGIVVTPDDVVLYPIPMPAPMPVVNPAPAPVPAVATAIQPSAEGLVAGPIAPAAAAEAAAATEDVPAPVHVAGRGRRLAASRASTRAVAGRVGVSTSAHAAATRALAARKPPTFALRAAFHRTGAGRMIMPLRRA